ncbi:MAG: carbamoyltransferase [Acidimicrobiales bacterium]|nr:carbamoyltransferase [Acidimicrobiales bacterium]MCB1015618.1 carbamoyltransferase [Acidimicrobiales bacterium]MCB9373355.1 carbamoyltransferase [Microthrixaceae bacterium]
MNILGISGFYHDSAAALVQDGVVVAAAQEERFTRKRHDADFPVHSIAYCLRRGGVEPDGIDAVAFYDKPITTFVRLLKTYMRVGPRGFRSFQTAMPIWLREKLWIPYQIEKGLKGLGYAMPKDLYFTEHHESHAASAFYPSPFDSAAVLTFDGVGEWATSSIGIGRGHELTLTEQLNFPHSIGLLYSAFTYHCGFRVNSGEYKLMGLAPYGEPTYKDLILDELVDLHDDGSFTLDMKYFGYLHSLKMTNDRFDKLFGAPARAPESELTKREMDMARSIQEVTEEIVLKMAHHAVKVTGERRACLAGGVALNCVSNGRLLREGPFDEIWIQPAAGDAGGAIGTALYAWHQIEGEPRTTDGVHDGMSGAYLGPRFSDDEIARYLDDNGYAYERFASSAERAERVAELVDEGNVLGLFLGRMEFGPRALGHRSIIGDPRSPKMQSIMNLKIKHRESFRPFAPAVLAERASEWFDIDVASPYMMITAGVTEDHRVDTGAHPDDLRAWVNEVRSDIPAVTHVDHSARLQTVDAEQSPEFHEVIAAFEARTGCPVLINTSFNVRGEPIVCTPDDAYRCFMRTEMDYLVLEHFLLEKVAQPDWDSEDDWQSTFELD